MAQLLVDILLKKCSSKLIMKPFEGFLGKVELINTHREPITIYGAIVYLNTPNFAAFLLVVGAHTKPDSFFLRRFLWLSRMLIYPF